MPEEAGDQEVVVEPELEDAILDVFDESAEVALSTHTVSDAVDREGRWL